MEDSSKPRTIVLLLFLIGITITRTEVAFAEKLRVAYTAFAGTFTILWVGHEAGLYRKNGVELELLYIGSSTRAVQALLGGDIDIVYSAAGAVVDANRVLHPGHRRSRRRGPGHVGAPRPAPGGVGA